MIVATIQEVNAISLGCCACPWPECPAPQKECQSMSASASCADDDYTDALAEWGEGLAEWLAAPQNEWLAARAAWLAVDPERDPDDYPIPMPEARDREDYGVAEPEKPAGYDDVSHGCYAPFVQPDGDPTDALPVIYRELAAKSFADRQTGTIGHIVGEASNNGEGAEVSEFDWWQVTYTPAPTDDNPGHTDADLSARFMQATKNGPSAEWELTDDYSDEEAYAFLTGLSGSRVWTLDDPQPELTCSAASRVVLWTKESSTFGSPQTSPTLADVPWEASENSEWWDLTREDKSEESLSSGVSKSDVIARANRNFPETWPDIPQGTSCLSSASVNWPTIGDLIPWPECQSGSGPQGATGTAAVTKIRYRIGIPNTAEYAGYDDAHAAWLTAHAAWVILPPADRGPEPRDAIPRSTYACQWDEVFFPDGYDATINDPEVTPPVPLPVGWTHPQIPDPDASPPSLVQSREWTWGGSLNDPWSEWFEIGPPSEPGETRPVNLLVKCFKSTRLGVKPTAHGETYPLPE